MQTNFLSLWTDYLLKNKEKLRTAREYGDLYESFIAQFPEMRKEFGVFYTPQYIVDYIVENTLGKLIKGKTPEEISKIKVLDPSCGSGSFLLGAYDYLLHYHLDYYLAHYQENNKERGKYLTNENKLTTSVKKQILLDNIFGVDIDSQAVEVSRLSLLIKCLEGETQSSMEAENKLFKQKVLPTLDYNILCGNSLIAPDFYDNGLFLTPQEERKINVFDWKEGFKAVFKQGGFDLVIGNPPYVRADLFANQKDYLESHFQSYEKTADLYVYFLEKAFLLLKSGGLYGVIVANKWFKAKYAEKLRGILSQKEIVEIVDFGDLPVFGHVAAYPCILLMKNGIDISDNEDNNSDFFPVTNVKTLFELQLRDYVKEHNFLVNKKSLKQESWSLSNSKKQSVLDKLNQKGMPLSQYINNLAYRGLITGLNEAFVIDTETKNRLIKKDKKNKELIKPFLAGKDLHYYENLNVQRWLIFMPSGWTKAKSNNSDSPFDWLQKNYSAISEYLLPFKEQAEKRYDKGQYWWELRKCAYYEAFEQPKIMYQVLQVKNAFTFDIQGLYCNNSVWFIPKDDKYLLGLLNSKLGWFLISNYCTQIQNGYQLIFEYLSKIPIKSIDFENGSEKNAHNQIIKSVVSLLDLHEKKVSLKLAHEIEQIDRRIKHNEKLINEKLYELYELTKEEIEWIEQS